jgi:hypothetical protein
MSPLGHRLVIQHVSGEFLIFSGTPSFLNVRFFVNTSSVYWFFAPANPEHSRSMFDQPVLIYADAGATLEVELDFNSSATFGGNGLTLSGYLLDCTASPCAPIAQ